MSLNRRIWVSSIPADRQVQLGLWGGPNGFLSIRISRADVKALRKALKKAAKDIKHAEREER